MPEGRLTVTGSIGGISFSSSKTRSADGQIGHQATLAAAKSGTLSTRTSDTAGTLTLGAGHGITDGDVIDIYWDGGVMYNATVGTVAGNDVPFTGAEGASGVVLPAGTTAVTAQKQQVIDTDFDGDLLKHIGALCTKKARVGFYVTASEELSLELTGNELWEWAYGDTETNPLAGHVITHIVVTQGDSAAAATFRLGAIYDSTE